MKTNLKTLKLINHQSGSIRIALTYENQPDQHESFWVIGKEEIEYTIRRLLGNEKTNFMINDCNYHLSFGTNGIYCVDLSNEKIVRHYVTFPGKILADALQLVSNWTYQEDYRRDSENVYTVSQDTIDQAAYENRNRSKVIYHDTEDFNVRAAIIRLLNDPQTKDYFKRNLKSFVRQAGEIQGTFNIALDSYAERAEKYPSFYFWLKNKDDKQYYNGGIINHAPRELTPDYSIHT